jgi:2-polyprenyl-6-methoxyphenol hydroxylase-like FAD-dependent oxidoreductase
MTTHASPDTRRILIIGGGIAGMSAALSLAETGAQVRLIDRDPDWKVYGAGITITGPTLRVMKRLGILDLVLQEGWTADGLLACDAAGQVIAEITTGARALDGVPGAGGLLRPTLHKMLADRIRGADIALSLGLSVTQISDGLPKRVTFSDGTTGEYDLVVGADGIFSQTRDIAFPGLPAPHYVGQVCWRLMSKRHPRIERRTYFLGGPMKVGMNPVSPDSMYMFLLEPATQFTRLPDDQLHLHLGDLMAPYGGIVADVRATLGPESNIVARPLETIFLPQPWYRDGIVLIGDAAHATTPQLASGAGMAMEDGVVLGECLSQTANLDEALEAFMHRRFDRCAMVVENSLKLGQLERTGATPLEQVKVVEAALNKLNDPY